ncbi:NrdR family transcriptional regulator [Marinitoga sp. 1135]|uniref:Transcriptional repressor NrdR n=1 Tax=Marinitoga piezophila (strain DSM 14283 / JCM 11233 / KA3) TaxID=443254 RepID=H2J5X8_MARPK|nr:MULTISPECIES: transcriptional regulator NrdR [Marinitoga]AEX86197.1 transcriptional regulator NrdR [Marinitoga piezophila KA3]APT76610.1 NrdR family transcriptional regulator [Marinitoga sp. 1137]NUU96385.1 NrdR family transcriptional regulator [Marinitoga sp. 1135]NUU98307.1 NrdR family transcriptional regulator [Marinitoga sp. 1138]
MKCPYCGHDETRVLDSRTIADGTVTRRRRECLKCNSRFTTYERYEMHKVFVIKKNGERELFDRQKILDGLIKACHKRSISYEQLENVAGQIEEEIRKMGTSEIESAKIGDLVMKRLKELDHVAYVRFASVYKEFGDLDHFVKIINDLRKKEENN